jgi:hypothetical protein
MDYTAKIAQFVVHTRHDAIPAKALETAKIALLD